MNWHKGKHCRAEWIASDIAGGVLVVSTVLYLLILVTR